MAFGAFAAFVQLSLGGVLLFKNPRNERVAIFGLLFLLNGVVAALTFVGTGFPEVRDAVARNAPILAIGFLRSALFFEISTNLVLLVLACIYPRRPDWLRKAPHMVWVFGALMAGLLLLRFTTGDALLVGRSNAEALTARNVLVAYGVFELVFPALFLRWALLWRQPMPRELRSQFALVFAAVGVRAVHQMAFVPFVEISDILNGRGATLAGLVLGGLLVAIVITSLVWGLGLMIQATWRLPRDDRPAHYFVLVFLAFGLLEGAMNIFLNRGLSIRWWHTLTGDFDVLVIRPVLLWFAITRTQFLDVRLRSGHFAWAMAFALTAAVVMGGVFEAFGDRGSLAVQWTLSALVGLAVASSTVAVWHAILLSRSEAWSRSPTPSEVYSAQLEEAYRNGEPSLPDQVRLTRLRSQLGIDDAMHQKAERRIRASLMGQNGPSTSIK